MGGSLEFGTPDFNVVNETPPKPLVTLDDEAFSINIIQGARDFTVSLLDDRVYDIELRPTNFDLVYEDSAINVEAYVTVINLSEYDQRLLDLYSYYGFADIALDALRKIDRLVRVEMYEAGIGITNE